MELIEEMIKAAYNVHRCTGNKIIKRREALLMILINKKISNLCGIIYIGTGLSKLAGWKLLTMILLLFVIIIISVSMFLRYKNPEKYAKKGETAPLLLCC